MGDLDGELGDHSGDSRGSVGDYTGDPRSDFGYGGFLGFRDGLGGDFGDHAGDFGGDVGDYTGDFRDNIAKVFGCRGNLDGDLGNDRLEYSTPRPSSSATPATIAPEPSPSAAATATAKATTSTQTATADRVPVEVQTPPPRLSQGWAPPLADPLQLAVRWWRAALEASRRALLRTISPSTRSYEALRLQDQVLR